MTEFSVGEIVKVIDPECSAGLNARVKILQLHENNKATVQVLFSKKPPIIVSLDSLAPNTQTANIPVPVYKPVTLIQPTPSKSQPQPRAARPMPFDPADFSDSGVAISCRCGHITKHIPRKLIQLWNNENAAINYVIGLCSHCMTPHQPRYNATGSYQQ